MVNAWHAGRQQKAGKRRPSSWAIDPSAPVLSDWQDAGPHWSLWQGSRPFTTCCLACNTTATNYKACTWASVPPLAEHEQVAKLNPSVGVLSRQTLLISKLRTRGGGWLKPLCGCRLSSCQSPLHSRRDSQLCHKCCTMPAELL